MTSNKENKKILSTIPKVETVLDWIKTIPELKDEVYANSLNIVRTTLSNIRNSILNDQKIKIPDKEEIIQLLQIEAKKQLTFNLRPVVNATGIIIHTNLGRSLIAKEAVEQALKISVSYSTLEYDPKEGIRKDRQKNVENLLNTHFNSQASFVVNNNAAAIFLITVALAKDKEILISRGELVEIGSSFRLSEIIKTSGAKLCEIGSTNQTSLNDYKNNITNETAFILKVHTSNYKIIGFTSQVPISDLATLSREKNIPLVCDLGSGSLLDLKDLNIFDELLPSNVLKEGADLITFSGDKLVGASQAGIILGNSELITKLKSHPLARAVRIDKMNLATLETTLRLATDPNELRKKIPTYSMLLSTKEELQNKAKILLNLIKKIEGLSCEIIPTQSQIGGGSAPEHLIPSFALSVSANDHTWTINKLEEHLRNNDTPIISRIWKNKLLLDVITIQPEDFQIIFNSLKNINTIFI